MPSASVSDHKNGTVNAMEPDTSPAVLSARATLVRLAKRVVNIETYAQDPELLAELADVPVYTLLLAIMGLGFVEESVWQADYKVYSAAHKIVTVAQSMYASDVDVVTAIAAIASADADAASTLANQVFRLSRSWAPHAPQMPEAGALSVTLFDTLFERTGFTSADFVRDALFADALDLNAPSANPGVLSVGRALVAQWEGTLNSLVETTRLLDLVPLSRVE